MSISQPIPSSLAADCLLRQLEQDNRPPAELLTLMEICDWRARHQGQSIAFTFLEDGEDQAVDLTYHELDLRARQTADALRQRGRVGDRVLILQEPGIDYIVSLFGCMYAGQIAVPVYPPELLRLQTTLPRLQAIARDAGAVTMLSSQSILGAATGPLWSLSPDRVIVVEEIRGHTPSAPPYVGPRASLGAEQIALLQYTSGSTGTPRGVALTHRNVLENLNAAYQIWDVPDAVAVFWLPPYHDMGLIGGILLPVYGGRRVVLMSPKAFLQRPARLLQAISRYRGTSSGSPNFGYELCIRKVTEEDCKGLDLSSWRIAVCGAEPVRAKTMEQFAAKFAPYGFDPNAVTPAYGMAESTVVISGKRKGTKPLYVDFDGVELQKGIAIPLESHGSTDAVQRLVGCGPVIPGGRAMVVNPSTLESCEPGEIGEIWVQGPSVAKGYWNQPETSAQVFGAQLATGDRSHYLRTGDLGFLFGDQLFVNGRLKELIILAGRNYYPHDLEQTFQATSPALRADCGVAFSIEENQEEKLVIVQEVLRPQKLDLDKIIRDGRVALAETFNLSPHAVILVASGSLPKTSSGKLRRQACKEAYLNNELRALAAWSMDGRPVADDVVREAPASPTEFWMADQWRSVLGIDDIARHDNFFHLGGHSLSVLQLLQQIREQRGIVVPLTTLFDHPTLAAFTQVTCDLPNPDTVIPVDSVPATATGASETRGPLTHAQRRFWTVHQLEQQGAFSQLPLSLRFSGTIDAKRLTVALERLIARHDALRTRFTTVNGQPVQEVLPEATVTLVCVDLSSLHPDERINEYESVRERLLRTPFDLGSAPLFRVAMIQWDPTEWELLFVWHHIVCDGWSAYMLIQELAAEYATELDKPSPDASHRLPAEPPHPLLRLAAWEQSDSGEIRRQQGIDYWRERLQGAPTVLEIPTDYPRVLQATSPSRAVTTAIPEPLREGLRSVAERLRMTEFMLHLSAWQYLLARYSGSDEVLVGVPTANRPEGSMRHATGCFINTVACLGRVAGETTIESFLVEARSKFLADLQHADTPFESVVDALRVPRTLGRTPLVQHLFLFQPAVHFPSDWSGASLQRVEADYSGMQAFDLSLIVEHHPEPRIQLVYSPQRFDAPTVERMLANYLAILERIGAAPSTRWDDVPVPNENEKQQLSAWNATDRTLPSVDGAEGLFEIFAKQSPDAIAVTDALGSLTYRELDEAAEQLATNLRGAGIGPNQPVGLYLNRTRLIPISILAIWKAKAAYVPLDPNYPPARIQAVLEDCQPALVLSETGMSEALRITESKASRITVWELDPKTLAPKHAIPIRTAASIASPSDNQHRLAYVIYTSGSTGKPKGVMVTQVGVINLLQSFAREPGFSEQDCCLALTTISFDISVLELFLPLTTGGQVVIAGDRVVEDPNLVPRWLASAPVTWIQGTPSTFRLLLTSGWTPASGIRLLCGGEPLTPELAKQLLAPGVELWNVYGPTETTVWSTLHRIVSPSDAVSIGHPLDNTQAWIIDRHGRPAPIGVPGDLVLAGDGVARGYWNRPDLTSERFVECASSSTQSRGYRTGDVARWRNDGTLQFYGRSDRQVKVRGHRIELGDVEATLERHPEVVAAAVVRVEQAYGAALVAYCSHVSQSGMGDPPSKEINNPSSIAVENDWTGRVREFMRAELPEYMAPSHYVWLARLPRTPAGKIDYHTLPTTQLLTAVTNSVAPRTPTESDIASLWCEVLLRDSVGVHDNFFDLGGHSLMAAQLFARLRERFGGELSLRELFHRPTIAEQADWIVSHQLAAANETDAEKMLRQLEAMSDADAIQFLTEREES